MDTALKLGTKGLIKKSEFIQVIIQCLHLLGYKESATTLERESCFSWKSKEMELLESFIENAKWDDCIKILDKINGVTDDTRTSALLAVFEQYLFECLCHCDVSLALDVLQKKVSRSAIGDEYVAKLAHKLISNVELDRGIEEKRRSLVSKLAEMLPPPIGFLQRRLECLVERAVCSQIDHCWHHNSSDISLYRDHSCHQNHFPTETIQILTDHQDEVWFVQFSNSGRYLASSSSDCTAIIWQVHDDNKVTSKHKLNRHKKSISFLAWSPDDTLLLTCGNMEFVNLWDVATGLWKHKFGDENFTVSSCAWFHDSKSLICGSSDPKEGICQWDCNGNEMKAWQGNRMPKVNDLAMTPDGKNLVGIFSDKEIRIWEVSKNTDGVMNVSAGGERVISEKHFITSLSVSGDSEFLIVSLNSQEIHMWDIARNWSEPMIYNGHSQQKYVIRSCFGGLGSMFIASGSEDSKVYIWNRRKSQPIEILSGHKKTVNCVSWNPKRLQMLASASDDGTIRIWGPSPSN